MSTGISVATPAPAPCKPCQASLANRLSGALSRVENLIMGNSNGTNPPQVQIIAAELSSGDANVLGNPASALR